MSEAPRVAPAEAERMIRSDGALLVCAYEDEDKCRSNQLDGAITLRELQARGDRLPQDKPLVFY